MKRVFFATAILLTGIAAQAQKSPIKFQGGLDLGIPAHNLDGTSIGLGADVMAIYKLSKEAAFTGDFGYSALLGKNGAGTTSLLPLRFGIRYYPTDNFFVAGKIGAGFISNDGSSVTTTAYSFGMGGKIASRTEIGVSYDGYSKNGTVGLVNLRLGYYFN
jgi:hypothetical protein